VVVNVAWWCSSTPGQVWTWRYTPIVGVWIVAGVLMGAFLLAHRRAGRRPARRDLALWLAGVAAIVVVSEWPIGQLGAGYLATLGVVRYLGLSFVAAPLLLAATPTWLIDRWVPRASRRGRALALLTRWPIALVVFNLVLLGTHLPVTIDTLKTSQLGSFGVDLLHLSAALVWWWPAIRREPERGALDEPVRSFYLFASSVLMFVPGAILTFSPLPLYGLYELAPPLWLSYDAIVDQQVAGITMNVIGGLMIWTVIGVLFLGWARDQQRVDTAARRTRDAATLSPPADRPGSVDPPR
jgi:putative membrane protein